MSAKWGQKGRRSLAPPWGALGSPGEPWALSGTQHRGGGEQAAKAPVLHTDTRQRKRKGRRCEPGPLHVASIHHPAPCHPIGQPRALWPHVSI